MSNKQVQQYNPPAWVLRFLHWFCAENFHEEIEGDLFELFHEQVEAYGYKKAKRRFALYIFPYLRLYFLGNKKPSFFHLLPSQAMIINYLKIAWRTFKRNRVFSLISLLGLATGMVALLFISEYVRFEKSYDRFHEKTANLYRLRAEGWHNDGRKWFQGTTNFPIAGPTVADKVPEVLAFVRLYDSEGIMRPVDSKLKKSYKETNIYYADSSFLEMFSFPLLYGNIHTALSAPNSLVLTESMARKYFGKTDVIGETIRKNQDILLKITGVLEDIPENSHLKFDFLISYYTLTSPNYYENWGWTDFYTYVQLAHGADIEKLHKEFDDILYEYKGEFYESVEGREFWRLQPLAQIHLHSGFNSEAGVDGQANIVHLLFAIGVFVMILAWINFINISTARAVERSKEIGIRKASGATRKQVITQFLLESFLINGLALLCAILSVKFLAPAFSMFTGHTSTLWIWEQPSFWLTTIGIWIFGSIASGFYPAFVMSSFRPISVIKGKRTPGSISAKLRKGLVVFQFAMAIVLVIGTVAIYSQIQFMREQNLGINIKQIYTLHGPQAFVIDSTFEGRLASFHADLLKKPGIQKFTASQSVPSYGIGNWGGYIRRGDRDASHAKTYSIMSMDENFLETFELGLLAGRNFSREISTDNESVIINETALRQLDFESPESAIDQMIYCPLNGSYDGTKARVIGVVKDHHQFSLRSAYRPIIYTYSPAPSNFFSLQLSSHDLPASIDYIQQIWNQHFGPEPFDGFFLDDQFSESYRSDVQFGELCALFAGLAIFIALLGLFGLSTYMTLQRSKEISIRKVLGATAASIVFLLSRQFLLLVLISGLISVPVAYWAVQFWLEGFAFNMPTNPLLFILPIIATLLIAGLAVSGQTIRSAQSNPADSLRQE